MNARQSERRRYFRIDDYVRLSFDVVNDLKHLPGSQSETTVQSRRARLQALEREFNAALNALWLEHPLAAKALGQLNGKLDLLSESPQIDEPATAAPAADAQARSVNISACGIAFEVAERLSPGQLLDMRLTLLPSETRLRVMARVVSVDAGDDSQDTAAGTFLLRAEFACQDTVSQETLISHIVQRQQALRFAGGQ